MPFPDTQKFDGLAETEILRRLGALLAKALVRSGRLRSRGAKAPLQGRGDEIPTPVDPGWLVTDPLKRQIVDYLCFTGAASPAELRRALGLRPRSLTRALERLRRGGLCEVVGRTRAARYRLRRDFAQN